MAKGKRMKKNRKASIGKIMMVILISILIILISISMFFITKRYILKEEGNRTNNHKEVQPKIEKEYTIADFENYSFENAKIVTENEISHIDIVVKNNQNETTPRRPITILFSNETKQMKMTYALPEIEANQSYHLALNIVSSLADIEKIEIK